MCTNYVPKDEEISGIQATVGHLEVETYYAERQLETLQRLAAQLQSRIRSLMDSITAHQALCSPMRRFPPEMLLQVFHYCLDSLLGEARTRTTLNPRQAPWNFSRVCRRWRAIVLNEPSLWSQVYIIKQHGPALASPILLQQQLLRSQQRPLVIVVKPDIHGLGRDSSLLSILAGVSERWETATIVAVANSGRYAQTILNKRIGRFPALKTLQWHQVEDTPVLAFQIAPLLRSVTWTGGSFGENTLPWQQLTHVSLFVTSDPETRENILRVLPRLVRVVELQLSAQQWSFEHSRIESFMLPQLQLLRLNGGSQLLKHILRKMNAPSLSSLSLRDLLLPHRSLAPTNSRITKLQLSKIGNNLDIEQLVNGLKDIDTLEYISLHFNPVYYSHGMDLRPLLVSWSYSGSLPMNPRLSIFSLRNGRADSGTLMQMLLTRWNVETDDNELEIAIPRCARLINHHWVPGPEDDDDIYQTTHEERLECIAELELLHFYCTDDRGRVETSEPEFCDACRDTIRNPWVRSED